MFHHADPRRDKEFHHNIERKLKIDAYRVELRNKIVSLHKSIKGSKLIYKDGPIHHVWQDIILLDKKGKEIARVCTTGSKFLNHWFVSEDR